jgi:hypothetical protein
MAVSATGAPAKTLKVCILTDQSYMEGHAAIKIPHEAENVYYVS